MSEPEHHGNDKKVMMFTGASDDLIYYDDNTDTTPRQDANNNPLDEASVLSFGGWIVDCPTFGAFRVLAHYGGTWSFSVAMMDEGTEMGTKWMSTWVTASSECGYSAQLNILVDASATVVLDAEGKHRP